MEQHQHPHPPQQPPQGQQIQVAPPDPDVLAAMDAQFRQVDLKLGGGEGPQVALCKTHDLEVCKDCGIDFFFVNQTARVLSSLPKEIPVPPPPNAVHPGRSQMVTKAKDEGNVLFKKGQHQQAVGKYEMAAQIAASRFPWEASQLMREELSTILSNRSAAFLSAGDPRAALIDADAVISLKKPWSKGHFRRSKALLALGRFQEARDSAETGLQFEPESTDLSTFIQEIDSLIQKAKEAGLKA